MQSHHAKQLSDYLFYDDGFISLYCGDVREVVPQLPDEIVQTCVTSPPYFSLRDYGHAGQIGLEPTPAEFVAELVAVFMEVRRVMRTDATAWINLGDSYAGSWGDYVAPGSTKGDSKQASSRWQRPGYEDAKHHSKPSTANVTAFGLKKKDLIGIPWRVAFALQDAGFWLRQDIIWSKPNPMPESVTDRCTKSHEYIFLLAKAAKYYYDNEAIKEPLKDGSVARLIQDVVNQAGSDRVPGKTNGAMKAVKGRDTSNGNRNGKGASTLDKKAFDISQAGGGAINANRSGYFDKDTGEPLCGVMANKKSVWTVTTRPFKEAHFATFPMDLITPCILAGSAEGDTVLDPFAGAGTTLIAAKKHGRKAIGVELNPEYCEMIVRRIKAETSMPLFDNPFAAFNDSQAAKVLGNK